LNEKFKIDYITIRFADPEGGSQMQARRVFYATVATLEKRLPIPSVF
jgi:hypothetical protein